MEWIIEDVSVAENEMLARLEISKCYELKVRYPSATVSSLLVAIVTVDH